MDLQLDDNCDSCRQKPGRQTVTIGTTVCDMGHCIVCGGTGKRDDMLVVAPPNRVILGHERKWRNGKWEIVDSKMK